MSDPVRFFRPLDALVLIAVGAAAAWGLAAFRVTAGARAVVFVGDRKFGWYDLAGPRHIVPIPTRLGRIQAEFGEGTARIVASPCRNQICVRTGAVRHSHSEVVCMPARLLIVIESGQAPGDADPDAITY